MNYEINSLTVYDILEYFDDHLWQLEKNFSDRHAGLPANRTPREQAEISMIDVLSDFGSMPDSFKAAALKAGLHDMEIYRAFSRVCELALKVHFGSYSKFVISLDFYKNK